MNLKSLVISSVNMYIIQVIKTKLKGVTVGSI